MSVGSFPISCTRTLTTGSWTWTTPSLPWNLDPWVLFLKLRTPVLNSQGFIRGDCYQPYKIHLSKTGAKIVGLRINKYLKNLIRPVQVQVPTPPAAVSILHPREAELASLWLLVRGYPIPTPLQPQSHLSPSIPLPIPSPPTECRAGTKRNGD